MYTEVTDDGSKNVLYIYKLYIIVVGGGCDGL